MQWLRDGLKLIHQAGETEALARSVRGTGGVYLVPAFTGLGAPYWDPMARGALLGLTRDTGIAEIVRAALEAVCYQTRDLMSAMIADTGTDVQSLRVDGGMVRNDWVMQFLADLLARADRPACRRRDDGSGCCDLQRASAPASFPISRPPPPTGSRNASSGRRWRKPIANGSMPAGRPRSGGSGREKFGVAMMISN